MTPTPETPRTDAVSQTQVCGNPLPFEYVHVSFARQLERELAEAKSWLDERYKALSEADERAEKAEAEVERLTNAVKTVEQELIAMSASYIDSEHNLRRAIKIAELSMDGWKRSKETLSELAALNLSEK